MQKGWNQDPFLLFGEKLNYPRSAVPRIDAVVNYAGSAAVISFLNCVWVIFPVH